MPDPADKFTRYRQIASTSRRFNLQSPILAAYEASNMTTKGVVQRIIEMPEDQLDRCEVLFRDRLLQATCCHPDISEGLSVSMIEQPIGIWWATVLQKSWYSRPLAELIEKGRPYQAALEYILSFGPKWRPTLIVIDKRGEEIEPPTPPTPDPDPTPDWPDYVPIDLTQPGFIVGYTKENWPYDPSLFDLADLNGDGFVDEAELRTFLTGYGYPARYSGTGSLLITEFFVASDGTMYARFALPRVVADMYSRVVAKPPYIQFTDGVINSNLTIYRKSDGAFLFSTPFTGGSDPSTWIAGASVASLQVVGRASGWKIDIAPISGVGWSPAVAVFTLT